MKINSNSVHLAEESQEYQKLESILKKIASENDIADVKSVNLRITMKEGIVQFKQSTKHGAYTPISLDDPTDLLRQEEEEEQSYFESEGLAESEKEQEDDDTEHFEDKVKRLIQEEKLPLDVVTYYVKKMKGSGKTPKAIEKYLGDKMREGRIDEEELSQIMDILARTA